MKSFSYSNIYLAAIILASATNTFAQTISNDILDEVVVISSKLEQKNSKALPTTIVINLENNTKNTLAEILSRQAGIEIRQSGGIGTQTSVFMRGDNSSKSLILLDNIPLNSLSSTAAAIENIDINSLSSIEIVQGNVSSLYGSNAMGGVINLITKPKISNKENTQQIKLNLKAGSHNTYGINLGLNNQLYNSQQDSITSYGFNINDFYTKGINAIDNTLPTQTFSNPDKDSYHQKGANLYLSHKKNKYELGLNAGYSDSKGNYDNIYGASTDVNDYSNILKHISLYSKYKFNDKLNAKLDLGYKQDATYDHLNYLNNFYFINTNKYISTQFDYAFNQNNIVSLQAESLKQNLASDVKYDKNARTTNSLRLGYVGEFDRGQIQANIRYDNVSNSKNKFTHYAAYGLNLTPNLKFILSNSTGFRSPSFNDLYYPYFGNPNLHAETNTNYEIGLQYTKDKLYYRTNLYQTNYRDLIGYDSNFNLNNINKAKIKGIENILRYKINNLQLNASLNIQQPKAQDKIMSNIKEYDLIRRAKIYGNIGASYILPDLNNKLEIGTNIHFTDKTTDIIYDSNFNKQAVKLSGYSTTDIYANYNFNKELKLSLNINNIFNRRKIADIYGYNKSGIEAYIGLIYISFK